MYRLLKPLLSAICISGALFVAGCATVPNESLYDELGGQQGVMRIADAFLDEIGSDADIRPFFAESNLERFHEMFIEHLCAVTGGPCAYTGDRLEDVHSGMNISEAQFNRLVDLMINAMDRSDIAHPTQNKVLNILAPLRSEIIYR